MTAGNRITTGLPLIVSPEMCAGWMGTNWKRFPTKPHKYPLNKFPKKVGSVLAFVAVRVWTTRRRDVSAMARLVAHFFYNRLQ
jgi:hypothetical protein